MLDSGGEAQWYFSQVKGTTEEEVNEADIISTVEFNEDGELLATGDKGGRIVIFQREQSSKSNISNQQQSSSYFPRNEYNVYSTFQSHEAEFDYLKSLEIEEKINKIKWLRRKNVAHFLLSTNDKTVKLWKIRERNKRADVFISNDLASTRDNFGNFVRNITIPTIKYMDRTEVEAIPKRVFANAHTYHINSISLNSDQETFMSADDLRINLWHIEITNQSFNIVDIKPANMEELTEVITAAEFHPRECNLFVYSSSKGMIRLCDMRQSALCDTQAKVFEEREDPTTKNFFSEIISSISDVKFSHSGRYLCTRDYLHVKVWDLNMENRPVETYSVHDYLRNKLCILYENDCIFDKFECSWSSNDDYILSGSYNNFFKSFHRNSKQELMFECSRENSKSRQQLRPKRVINANLVSTNSQSVSNVISSPSLDMKRSNATKPNCLSVRDEVNVDNLDFTKKILHTSWHPKDNLVAIAATNNLYIFYNKESNVGQMNTSAISCMSSTSTSSFVPNSSVTTASQNMPNSNFNSIVLSVADCISVNKLDQNGVNGNEESGILRQENLDHSNVKENQIKNIHKLTDPILIEQSQENQNLFNQHYQNSMCTMPSTSNRENINLDGSFYSTSSSSSIASLAGSSSSEITLLGTILSPASNLANSNMSL